MPVYLYSHNPHSGGARELSRAMNIRRIRHEGSRYRPQFNHTIINWGCGPNSIPAFGCRVLNNPELVARASDKLAFFRHLDGKDVRIPEWTTDRGTARTWFDRGDLIVARTVLRGSGGEGIRIFEIGLDFVDAPLYTKYVKKQAEYRVHCFNLPGQGPSVVDLQRKARDPQFVGEPNWRVRNHNNGFIFVRNDVHAPEDVTRQALQAFEASGLDFGAVDVIYNESQQRAYVLEINTAPGLVGQTVQSYVGAFRQLVGQ